MWEQQGPLRNQMNSMGKHLSEQLASANDKALHNETCWLLLSRGHLWNQLPQKRKTPCRVPSLFGNSQYAPTSWEPSVSTRMFRGCFGLNSSKHNAFLRMWVSALGNPPSWELCFKEPTGRQPFSGPPFVHQTMVAAKAKHKARRVKWLALQCLLSVWVHSLAVHV